MHLFFIYNNSLARKTLFEVALLDNKDVKKIAFDTEFNFIIIQPMHNRLMTFQSCYLRTKIIKC